MKQRSKHEYSTWFLFFLIGSVMIFGVFATYSTESYIIENNETGTFGYYAKSYGYSSNPVLSLRNFNQSEKGLNMIVYARNYSGTVAGYNKNDSVRMWSYGAPLVIGSSSQHDLVLATGDLLAIQVNGTNRNVYIEKDLKVNGNYTSSDGTAGWTGTCGGSGGPHANKGIEVKNGIVVGCV
jgi:hypothetical protein